MLYCKNCKMLRDDKDCPVCGAKNLKQPKENDAVYLTTKRFVYAKMLEDYSGKMKFLI